MSMSADVIDEGKDVYFSCAVNANPEVYKVEWKHEVRLSCKVIEYSFPHLQNVTVQQDLDRGILISGTSLVLQRVNRSQAGNYSCVASNLEGDAESNPLTVRIRCKCQKASHDDSFMLLFQMLQYAKLKISPILEQI